jgi:hypothetical protein
MHSGQQLPRFATAKLKNCAYGRKTGEEVAHSESDGFTTITFMTEPFFGGISTQTMPNEKFDRNFVVIRSEGVGY